jgi:hypothetical protein
MMPEGAFNGLEIGDEYLGVCREIKCFQEI